MNKLLPPTTGTSTPIIPKPFPIAATHGVLPHLGTKPGRIRPGDVDDTGGHRGIAAIVHPTIDQEQFTLVGQDGQTPGVADAVGPVDGEPGVGVAVFRVHKQHGEVAVTDDDGALAGRAHGDPDDVRPGAGDDAVRRLQPDLLGAVERLWVRRDAVVCRKRVDSHEAVGRQSQLVREDVLPVAHFGHGCHPGPERVVGLGCVVDDAAPGF